jgi:hypothetical protein
MDRNISSDGREPEITSQELPKSSRLPQQETRNGLENELSRPALEKPLNDYRLTDTQHQAMCEIGRFRTLSITDLAHYRYQDDKPKMRQDCRQLLSQHLIQTRSLWVGNGKERLTVVTLTRDGKKALERSGEQGQFYAGFVKPAEMVHDSAIFRMYQAEAAKILKEGGQIRRITLDYELKRRVYSELAKQSPGSSDYGKRQVQIADEHGLKVVRGHIQLPDLRIDYQTQNGEMARIDLELATGHYRGGQIAAKAAAGFKFYASGEDSSRLSSVFDDHHITAEILWL